MGVHARLRLQRLGQATRLTDQAPAATRPSPDDRAEPAPRLAARWSDEPQAPGRRHAPPTSPCTRTARASRRRGGSSSLAPQPCGPSSGQPCPPPLAPVLRLLRSRDSRTGQWAPHQRGPSPARPGTVRSSTDRTRTPAPSPARAPRPQVGQVAVGHLDHRAIANQTPTLPGRHNTKPQAHLHHPLRGSVSNPGPGERWELSPPPEHHPQGRLTDKRRSGRYSPATSTPTRPSRCWSGGARGRSEPGLSRSSKPPPPSAPIETGSPRPANGHCGTGSSRG